ncbi:MAG: hypothetical protein L0H53_08860 [Candidatus Nitrosocosmicus sp.]|nr:hypothetical protein [Candidatus Nitrosocosmicus sp.]
MCSNYYFKYNVNISKLFEWLRRYYSWFNSRGSIKCVNKVWDREIYKIKKKAEFPDFLNFPNKAKKDKKNIHQNSIFHVYKKWYLTEYQIVIDFYGFDLNHLDVKIFEQFSSISEEYDGMTTIEDKAISHLKSGYENTYKKYEKIKELEDQFNKEMGCFLEENKKSLENLLREGNRVPDKNSTDMLLRYLLWLINYAHRDDKDTEYQLKRLEPVKIRYNDETIINLENPFVSNSEKILEFLRENHESIFKQIERFKKDIENIKKAIEDFLFSIKLILENSLDGLKGECDIENRL